jgi:serine protease AprX
VPLVLFGITMASRRYALASIALLALAGIAGLSAPATTAAGAPLSPALERIVAGQPAQPVELIVQAAPGATRADLHRAVRRAGGRVGHELRLIGGVVTTAPAAAAERLALDPAVRAVSLNAKIAETGMPDAGALATAYNQSIRADQAWEDGHTGRGISVALIDTGIQGDLPDFRRPGSGESRVGVSAVVNPEARNARDSFGHGTHVAGLIGGNGAERDQSDPLRGRYAGVAPEAELISVKADDGHGVTTVVDVIDGLQWVVDFKDAYDIRVVNLSLRSTVAESYRTDPLDAAAEAAWFAGIVVVTAAGNEGGAADAVHYAPANDPYVITVGSVDDMGTRSVNDDRLSPWSSRGVTQDGFVKPDVLAPGARLVSTVPAGSDYREQCPSCAVEGDYFRLGGTSMASAVTAGAVATLLSARPGWTPDEVKGALSTRSRPVHEAKGAPVSPDATTTTTSHAGEVALDKTLTLEDVPAGLVANKDLQPSQWIDPATGGIDYSRTSWSRTSWSEAVDPLRTSWSRTSWSRTSWSRTSWSASPQACADLERTSWSRTSWSSAELSDARLECEQLPAGVEATRTSWSRTSWSRTSWSARFDR